MTEKTLTLRAAIEHWPLARSFAISRGAKTEAVTVTVEIATGPHKGRGECVPYARYGETPETVLAAIESMKADIEAGMGRDRLAQRLPPAAARNAIDCALWDLEAKRAGQAVWALAGLPKPKPLTTAFTVALDTPDSMHKAAVDAKGWPLLKIKLGREGDDERLRAVRRAAPEAELIVDANEGWTAGNLAANIAACEAVGVTLIEQPLPEKDDAALAFIPRKVPICADESARGLSSLETLKGKYDAVNIKLDKTGGLTEAVKMAERAAALGLEIMAGCMVASSLAIAPAILFAQKARITDLDGPLWLAKDRPHGLRYEGSLLHPPAAALWG